MVSIKKEVNKSRFSDDIQEFIELLNQHEVRYVIVGGQAVIYYGHSRLTGDIDFLYDRNEQNVNNLFIALNQFWGGNIPGIENQKGLLEKGIIFQFGVPPNRIDLMNDIGNINFNDIWESREKAYFKKDKKKITLNFISLEFLIKNKRNMNRPRDQEDLKFLESVFKNNESK